MGGFTEWVETVADSADGSEISGERVTDAENASIGRAFVQAELQAAYCMSVCPAGEDVLART